MKKILIILLFLTTSLWGNRYVPDYVTVQYAGNLGVAAIGTGYEFFDQSLQVELLYGYLPKSIGGVSVHSLSTKISYTPWTLNVSKYYKLSPFTMGIGAIYNPGDDFFLSSPDRYPDEYYRQTALHFAPFIGMTLIHKKDEYHIDQMAFYVEVGTIDYYLRDYFRSVFEEGYLEIGDIINVAIGMRFHF